MLPPYNKTIGSFLLVTFLLSACVYEVFVNIAIKSKKIYNQTLKTKRVKIQKNRTQKIVKLL